MNKTEGEKSFCDFNNMRVLLAGLNSQFVHSSLALYYLREELPDGCDGVLKEYNINEPILDLFYDIVAEKPDVVAFSCYIWNKEVALKLIQLLKEAELDCIVIAGGPEVTYSPEDFSDADYRVSGALEPTWEPLLKALMKGERNPDLPGIRGEILQSSEWKFPYRPEDAVDFEHRLVYYESSRGCPYSCGFCLSSACSFTAFRPLDIVFNELDYFLTNPSFTVVKLVDRTFNAPPQRCKDILNYLLKHYRRGITFHFEIKGELLDEETVELLSKAPRGFFQVEIGIQSLNQDVLNDSIRDTRWHKVKGLYKKLIDVDSVHTHFDLIAGLPGETPESFGKGFNELLTVYPHYIQVGFLKLLPGTRLWQERETHGYVREKFPPYEVVRGNSMTTDDFRRLKALDSFMDRYYNRGLMRRTLYYALNIPGSNGYELFMRLASSDASDMDKVLSEYTGKPPGLWRDLLRLDGALVGAKVQYSSEEDNRRKNLASDREFLKDYLPLYCGFPAMEIYKRIAVLNLDWTPVFNQYGMIDDMIPYSSEICIDFKEKGKRKIGGVNPDFFLLPTKLNELTEK